MRRRALIARVGVVLLATLAPARAASRPKLVVLLVAEHFRPDYLDRYRASFSTGGFNRLLGEGAVFRHCRYEYLSTFPASGAALLATGAYPDRNGIVADYWYDRRSGRVISAVEDPAHAIVGAEQPQRPAASPARLIGTTLADVLRLATAGRSRTVSISLRDQTAVLLGGRKAAGCYWLDAAGSFVTSSYYAAELPAWVWEFHKTHSAQRPRNRAWKAIDAKEGAPPLRVINGEGADFFAAHAASPLALDDQFDFARVALEAEQLGRRPATDLLVMSFSSLYLLGLEVGAESPLMRDLVLRLDRKIAELLAELDGKLGQGNFWVVFAATQGLPELPEWLEAEGIRAGRVAGEQIAAAVNARLSEAFGPDRYVEKYVYPSLYLRPGRAPGPSLEMMASLAGEAARAAPGVAGYFVAGGGSAVRSPETTPLFTRSVYPDRSGDVLIAYQPYYMELHSAGRGVAPGSFYGYDTQVPLIFYGPAFRTRSFEAPVSPTDLAPTLATALGIPTPSSSTGRPLVEALQER